MALKIVPNPTAKRVDFEIVKDAKAKDVSEGTVKRGSATCPCCGYTTPVKSVREQLKKRHGGATDARLFCVVTTKATVQGRFYRLPTERDLEIVAKAAAELGRRKRKHTGTVSLVPDEQFTGTEPRRIPVTIYGMESFGDLFSSRQLLSLIVFTKLIECIPNDKAKPDELGSATRLSLAFSLDKLADLANSLCRWEPVAECPRQLFARQAMPMIWDFSEGVPIGESSGSWEILIERFVHVMHAVGSDWSITTPVQASATRHPLPDQSVQAFVTDPPYYYSVPYSDLSDFFFVWLKRSVGRDFPEILNGELTPKVDECVQNLPHAEVAH